MMGSLWSRPLLSMPDVLRSNGFPALGTQGKGLLMTVKRSWLRRIVCTLPGVGLAAWLAWTGRHAPAQDPGVSTTTRTYLNKTTISLPIVVDERHRSQLRNVLLYVKEGATQPWKLCDKATPAHTSFTYRAAGEGEYWFNIVS